MSLYYAGLSNSRGGKTVRDFGPDGRATHDVDYGHNHPPDYPGDPHVHDWDWSRPDNPRRSPGRPPRPGEVPDNEPSPDQGRICVTCQLMHPQNWPALQLTAFARYCMLVYE